jgi:hypothetical protein
MQNPHPRKEPPMNVRWIIAVMLLALAAQTIARLATAPVL